MERMRRSSSVSAASSSTSIPSPKNVPVLAIECISGTAKADEWSGELLQTGDIVEELRIGGLVLRSPFKGGKAAVQKHLHTCFRNQQTSIVVRVRRGRDDFSELQCCIVPKEAGGKKYVLRAIDDPNFVVSLTDRTEAECFQLKASRTSRMHSALNTTQLQDGYVAYPWEKKLQALPSPYSSSYLSILFLPKVLDKMGYRCNDVEDTLARANAWLIASQASGVPVRFTNVQTESMLTKISGETASSTVNISSLSDLANLANASLYGFEDYHGVDIGVVRAVRLWYSPVVEEAKLEVEIKEGDTKLGFAICRTEEGFIYITSVAEGDEDAPSARSGLSKLYKEATRASKLLVISRINNQKVLPWLVSPSGAIRSFDTVSLSQKLSLHRHAKVTIPLHVFMWDQESAASASRSISKPTSRPTPTLMPSPDFDLAHQFKGDQVLPVSSSEQAPTGTGPHSNGSAELRLDTQLAAEPSFRFDHVQFPESWF